MIAVPPPPVLANVNVPAPESVTLFSSSRTAFWPPPLFILIWPALIICVPKTESMVPGSQFRMCPLPSCRSSVEPETSKVTVLVPSVMQVLVELVGTPPLQLPATLQLPLPSIHVVGVPVSVHWPKPAAGESARVTARATTRARVLGDSFSCRVFDNETAASFIDLSSLNR